MYFAQIGSASLGILLGLNMSVCLIPKTLQDMCTSTHIEMMKDPELIKDVIRD